MKLLIVDDDMYIVRALISKINWTDIGIAKVFSAFSAGKAMEILKNEKIDIVLTDIEMPLQSGLDLAKWINEQEYDPMKLCLTCHAEFEFAKKALSLGFTDYFVKPIDFKEFGKHLSMLVEVRRKQVIMEHQRKQGEYLENNLPIIKGSFWTDLMMGRLGDNPAVIAEEAGNRQVEYSFDTEYAPVLILTKNLEIAHDKWIGDAELLTYGLINILQEVLDDFLWQRFITCETGLILIFEKTRMSQALEDLRDYIDTCKKVLDVSITVLIGGTVYGEGLPNEYKKLCSCDIMYRSQDGNIIFLEDNHPECIDGQPLFQLDLLLELLEKCRYDDFLNEMSVILDDTEKHGRSALRCLVFDSLQLFGAVLLQQGVALSEVMRSDQYKLPIKAMESKQTAWGWIEKMTMRLRQISAKGNEDNTLITEIKDFIDHNIGTKFSRRELAYIAHISPDYLTRLFKKVTGFSLVQYITNAKMNKAAQMIASGEKNISDIAQQLGYDNFSYFSNLFKKVIGSSPTDYKRNYQKNDIVG